MNRHDPDQTDFLDFYTPFGGKLSADNRWAHLASQTPWEIIEDCYAESLAGTGMGCPALSGRVAYGALIIKERLGITDEETVEQIKENPYLQYYLGLHEYREDKLFDPSMMVHFRSRFSEEHHRRINDAVIAKAMEAAAPRDESGDDGGNEKQDPPANAGKLLVDATCAPADITYPTDLKLLGDAREKTEDIIDTLHAPFAGERKKPRTYRNKARKQYLAIAKKKKPGAKKIRKALGQQLRFIKRNLAHIDAMLGVGASLGWLSGYQLKCLHVIHELYRQQETMHRERSRSVPDRIVSISQPHVRPIVRGKAGKSVEFGAKVSISHLPGGMVSLDRLSWDSYNECGDLTGQIEEYRERYGFYPESVHADAIYRTRDNRRYCKENGIRLSGRGPGRPRKRTPENMAAIKAQKAQERQDEIDRIPVEGKFGNVKRKGTLDRVMAKLSATSKTVVHVGFVVLNLDTLLRKFFPAFFWGRNGLYLRLDRVLEVPQRRVCVVSNVPPPLRTCLTAAGKFQNAA